MPRHTLVFSGCLVLTLAAQAQADQPPPEDALPLSSILERLEADPDLHYFDEVEWDDGRWEIEYYTRDRRKVKVYIDPRSGEAL